MRKILIVDDDELMLNVTVKRLMQENYEVMAASNGQEAVHICLTNHPDLVLLDIVMPGMDGYNTCQKIKQDNKTKDIAVLFVTGKKLLPQGIYKRCQDLGAHGYISKPFAMRELLEKIKEILGT
jgi:CheY-like chemotaxis protein